MRVRRVVRGLFFMGKQIAAVRLVIYSTNWVERLNHCYCLTLFLRGATHSQPPWFIFCTLLQGA